MPKIIGYKKRLVPHVVTTKEDFPDEFMYITVPAPNKQTVSVRFVGKNVYGFFVTNKEFNEKVAQRFCFDGWYDVPVLEYKSGEPIHIGVRSPDTTPSEDFLKKVKEGKFIKTHEENIRKVFEELGIPTREIRWWHKRLKWPFKE